MKDVHSEDHEALVMELLTGSKDADDADVKARLEGCAACRERVLELRGVVDGLSLSPAEHAELLASAAGPVAGEEEALDRFRRTLAAGRVAAPPLPEENRAGERPSSDRAATAMRRLPARRAPLLALAASLLVALSLVAWWVLHRDPIPAEVPVIELDAKAFAEAAPSGAQAARVDRFAWRESGVPSRAWQVEILAGASDDRDAPLLVSPRLIEPEWRPSAADAAALPTSFRWRIVAEDSRGERRRSAAVAVTQPAPLDRGP
ncbi:MAG: hypothetical protein JNL90_05290 [Planctomycetes bacterium]|nr:hypothetical protein [Planctomycetota bacterium]